MLHADTHKHSVKLEPLKRCKESGGWYKEDVKRQGQHTKRFEGFLASFAMEAYPSQRVVGHRVQPLGLDVNSKPHFISVDYWGLLELRRVCPKRAFNASIRLMSISISASFCSWLRA